MKSNFVGNFCFLSCMIIMNSIFPFVENKFILFIAYLVVFYLCAFWLSYRTNDEFLHSKQEFFHIKHCIKPAFSSIRLYKSLLVFAAINIIFIAMLESLIRDAFASSKPMEMFFIIPTLIVMPIFPKLFKKNALMRYAYVETGFLIFGLTSFLCRNADKNSLYYIAAGILFSPLSAMSYTLFDDVITEIKDTTDHNTTAIVMFLVAVVGVASVFVSRIIINNGAQLWKMLLIASVIGYVSTISILASCMRRTMKWQLYKH